VARARASSWAPLSAEELQALYHAIDRDTYAEVALGGIKDRAAHALLPPDDRLHPYVKDGWKVRYPYEPSRAVAALEQAAWRKGPDGMVIGAGGANLRVQMRATSADSVRRSAMVQDMWKQVGVEGEIFVLPVALRTNPEVFTRFPGVEITARGSFDAILTRLECSERPSPQNRYSGNNRGQWCNADYDRLVTEYRTSLREDQRGEAIRQVQNVMLDELPLLLLTFQVAVPFARRGVTAFQDDFPGGAEAGRLYGTYTRNAHEWDILS